MLKTIQKNRLPIIDLFRFYIVAMVLLFHAVLHGFAQINSGGTLMKNFITGAIYMDAFFILSGFILYYLYGEKFKNANIGEYKSFYLKRIIKIYPSYIIFTLVYMLCSHDFAWNVLPVQILCLQGFFNEIFSHFGNGGTWFISCIIFAYLCFPVLSNYVRESQSNMKPIVFLYILIVYISLFSVFYNVTERAIYINPFYRLLEFIIGMYLAKVFMNRKPFKYSGFYAIITMIILYVLVAVLYRNHFVNKVNFATHYNYYTCITIPLFSLMIYFCAGINNRITEKLAQSKILVLLSNLTFPFFLWQGISYMITKQIGSSLLNLFIVNTLVALITYLLIDKLLMKRLKAKILPK